MRFMSENEEIYRCKPEGEKKIRKLEILMGKWDENSKLKKVKWGKRWGKGKIERKNNKKMPGFVFVCFGKKLEEKSFFPGRQIQI